MIGLFTDSSVHVPSSAIKRICFSLSKTINSFFISIKTYMAITRGGSKSYIEDTTDNRKNKGTKKHDALSS
jgi:hypothetical protein